MPLRIPPRRSPVLVTLVQALNHICGEIMPARSADASRAKNLAETIKRDRRTHEERQERDALAAEVADVLLEAIRDGRLKVEGVPFHDLEVWRANPGIDWQSGRFCLAPPEIPVTLRIYHKPMVELAQAVALFEEQPEQPERSEPVAAAALSDFVHATMKAEPMVEAAVRAGAGQHFAPRQFTDSQWREAWRGAPGKLGRGKRPSAKSGA